MAMQPWAPTSRRWVAEGGRAAARTMCSNVLTKRQTPSRTRVAASLGEAEAKPQSTKSAQPATCSTAPTDHSSLRVVGRVDRVAAVASSGSSSP